MNVEIIQGMTIYNYEILHILNPVHKDNDISLNIIKSFSLLNGCLSSLITLTFHPSSLPVAYGGLAP